MRFEGKNILVVGGSSGIGLNLITTLHHGGAKIYSASRKPATDWPIDVNYLEMDVLQNVNHLANFLPEKLHGLVYSVGSITLKPFSRVSEADLISDFQLNVVGAAMAIQQALKSLKAAEGASVVLISSVASKTGMGFHTSIAAAKAGLEGFAFALAAELAQQHIRVNVVAPSLTDTPLTGSLLSTPEKRESSAKRHPLGRIGTASDISSAISFLLSEQSSWITGQIVGIDGGLSSLRTQF
ncbi:SDR family oxidoreductase [Pedobacter sp. Du54]|uniref:SDR family NAD(P)-dependent oxidoreductase n=1 Tax=Pedobacter anseongensis TaxID=3133439 RepID=UPI00309B792C